MQYLALHKGANAVPLRRAPATVNAGYLLDCFCSYGGDRVMNTHFERSFGARYAKAHPTPLARGCGTSGAVREQLVRLR